jgi:hypothetical protein
MLLRLGCFFALASGIASALDSTPLAAPAGSVVRPEPLATAPPVPHYEPINNSERAEIQERRWGRQRREQYIIGPCPEMFGAVQHCSSCGGENPAWLGNCLEKNAGNRICKCKSSTTYISSLSALKFANS